ncbi:ABC transporter permease [Devosia riboflavina]|uniref:ABC transporter permease n=1 Tax=Devosia riboflavina TaxID=46914 RepID=UPI003CC70D17
MALGKTRRQAMGPGVRRAIHARTIPVFNQMAGAGIITLPGIMSGQILAGTDPLVAAQSQIYLMCLLCSSSIGSVIVGVWLASRRLSDERERLRLDRLRVSRR